MLKSRLFTILIMLSVLFILLPEPAHAAFQTLQCQNGRPVAGTSLYDDSANGACRFTGVRYIFSTVICQFVTMVNMIMGKLYCSIQGAMEPVVLAAMTVFVMIYGVQMLMGTAQLNGSEVVIRVIKMALVLWLVTDPSYGVSAGVYYMFDFFMSFMTETTRWVVKILDSAGNLNMYVNYSYNSGVTSTFYFLDNWIYNAFTGALSEANGRVIGFFLAMAFVMPSVTMLALYWIVSFVWMLINTLMSFLMAVVAVAFLLGLSPIFLCFMLFSVTFQYFDQWLRFMISYSLQVMVSFAILTMWIFSLTMFAPFFNEMSDIIFPYQKIIRPSAGVYNPIDTWGVCPLIVTPNPIPSVRCEKSNFNPNGPSACTNDTDPGRCYDSNGRLIPENDTTTPGMTRGNQDFQNVIPPSKVPEMNAFLFYIFYHMISLIVVSYGFASLQKNSRDIAQQLAGPSFVPILNKRGVGLNRDDVSGSGQQSKKFMAKEMFDNFGRRHGSGTSPYEQMVHGASSMVGNR